MSYQCHNRGEFAPSIQVQDGYENTWARRMVDMEFRLDPSCVYSTSELGMKDKGCDGCKWKAGAGTEVTAGALPVGDGLADLQPGESGPTGIAGQADVGRSTDAVEQRGSVEQARSAAKLEAIYPGAAMYRPINQCDGCRRGLPISSSGVHYSNTPWDVIACTAHRYQPTEEK